MKSHNASQPSFFAPLRLRVKLSPLATLRDALLPNLLSGELSVAEIQGSRGGAENAETNT